MTITNMIKHVTRRFGVDLVRYPGDSSMSRTITSLSHHGIDCVLDVGANTGQYGQALRDFGYRGRIVSFEPLGSAFDELARRSSDDPLWDCTQLALGAEEAVSTLHVSAYGGVSSSLRPMLDRHREAAPYADIVGQQDVQVRRLDDVWRDHADDGSRIFLKVDVQGFEDRVLAGATNLLVSVIGVQAELSFVALYEGAPDWRDIVALLESYGLRTTGIDPEWTDPATGHVLQANGTFFRVD